MKSLLFAGSISLLTLGLAACGNTTNEVGGVGNGVQTGGSGGTGGAGGAGGSAAGGTGGTGGASCAALDAEYAQIVADHRDCQTDADCNSYSGACATTRDDCSGTVYVNQDADTSRLSEIDTALAACVAPDQCAGCLLLSPPPACIAGVCGGGNFVECIDGGKAYQPGDTFPSSDGCNTCSCESDGNIACTAMACETVCGGEANVQCGAGEFCNFPLSAGCGFADDTGICEPLPQGCTADCPGVCGCDGGFYCNECMANVSGVSVTDASACERECGGMLGLTCESGEYCHYEANLICGGLDAPGVCRDVPPSCDVTSCTGVCGCDGSFYCEECQANAAGTGITTEDTCNKAGKGEGVECGGDSECQGGLKCCYPCGVQGCADQCSAVDQNGECPAFP